MLIPGKKNSRFARQIKKNILSCVVRKKNSESDYLFFLHQNHNIFFSNIGNQNIFLEKNHNLPFKLNGRSLKGQEIIT